MESKKTLTQSQNLLRFVVRNNELQVKECLKQNLELNPEKLGRILWYAVQYGHLEIATLLIKVGANLAVTNPFVASDSSFLHDLVERKESRYRQLAFLMMEYGADVNARNQRGISVLGSAVYATEKAIDLIENLVIRGACLRELIYKVFYCQSCETELIRQLLERDSSTVVEMKLKKATAEMLHFSCSLDDDWQSVLERVRSANLRLDKGKICESDIKYYGSVFQAAIAQNKYELVELLIQCGSDVNKPTDDGKFPLYVASKLKQSDIMERLIQAGAEVNSRSSNGRSAIHAACEFNSIKNIRVLLRHGLDINLMDNDSKTPFSLINYFMHLNDTHRLIIKLLAVLVIQEKQINYCDLEKIESENEMYEYYIKCSSELMNMKNVKIMHKFSLLSILETDIRKILFASRRDNFVGKLNTKPWKKKFPIFHVDMNLALKNIKKQKKFLSQRDNALYESLKHIIPDLLLEKILYYLYFDDN